MKQNHLIFLISQPRSGSTLLQKLLSQNSKIFTLSEPWLMLHPAYSLKRSGIYTEYDKETERNAFYSFIENLPGGGKEVYLEKLRSMYLGLYDEYLKDSGKTFFLDKTPRYYHIIRELKEIFPDAKYIYLRRNPISVLYSIIMTWNVKRWHLLSTYKHDLTTAIDSMLSMVNCDKGMGVKYEDLVQNPDKEISKICSYIDIPFEKNMLTYGNREKWEYGDQDYIYSHTKISSDRINTWQQADMAEQTWRVLSDYLEWIGKDRLEKLKYDYSEIRMLLDKNIPATSLNALLKNTFSLDSLLENAKNCLIENVQLKEKLLEHQVQNVELENYYMLRRHLDKHSEMSMLKQPLAKIRTYKYLMGAHRVIREKKDK